jgi:hypothetical protein
MQTDLHASVRNIIDQSLAGASLDPQARQTLREHLHTCAACTQYLEASNCAIAALSDFSFTVSPGLESKVLAALAQRAQQLEAADVRHQGRWHIGLLALAFTVSGSLAATQLSSFAAAAFHLQPELLHLGLATFWIAPSVLICTLLLLPGFQAALGSRKGLSL